MLYSEGEHDMLLSGRVRDLEAGLVHHPQAILLVETSLFDFMSRLLIGHC